ncbi:MAG TPA: ABC transporter permease [Bacilli bacterium]|nr:ABC transporter permease [Bacilli bacterium]
MRKYVIQRLVLALITAFIILSLTYILVAALPIYGGGFGKESSMFAYYQDQVKLGYALDFSTRQAGLGTELWSFVDNNGLQHFWYKRPILDLYFNWIKNIITKWDWGRSTFIKLNASAMSIILQRLPVSMYLNIISVIISVPLGILLGIWAGLKKNTWIDHTISTLVMIFISIPSFVVITFLIWILGYQLGWLPTQWPSAIMPNSFKVLGYIIPVLSLSFGSVCGYTRFVRAELCEVMSSEYLLLARTKGLTKNQAIVRHALRNAFVPILPSILAEFIGVLGGSMILESIYGIPGIGFLYITALNNKDYSVLMVDMAVFTMIGLVAGIVLDLSYGFIDPRIRMGAKK